MSKNRKTKIGFLLSLGIFIVSIFILVVNVSTSELKAQTACEDEEYTNVCCGPQCEINDEQENFCENVSGEETYDCCFDNCSDDELEID